MKLSSTTARAFITSTLAIASLAICVTGCAASTEDPSTDDAPIKATESEEHLGTSQAALGVGNAMVVWGTAGLYHSVDLGTFRVVDTFSYGTTVYSTGTVAGSYGLGNMCTVHRGSEAGWMRCDSIRLY